MCLMYDRSWFRFAREWQGTVPTPLLFLLSPRFFSFFFALWRVLEPCAVSLPLAFVLFFFLFRVYFFGCMKLNGIFVTPLFRFVCVCFFSLLEYGNPWHSFHELSSLFFCSLSLAYGIPRRLFFPGESCYVWGAMPGTPHRMHRRLI